MEPVIGKCVYFELLYLINQVAFNDLIRRTNVCSFNVVCSVSSLNDFKRSPGFLGLQIQCNLQCIEDQQIQTWPLHISNYNF